jgi:transcriptional regulator with XRE-family HTH domain
MKAPTCFKILRNFHGLSQERVAKLAGISVCRYARIERDELKPTPEEKDALLSILRVGTVYGGDRAA